MKKLLLFTTCLLAAAMINAQTLDEIVKKYTEANKLDKITNFKTLKITGNMSMMGMDMAVQMWMKNPNKIKQVYNINGQDMIKVYDGEKGYMVNPMAGSTDPVEMTADQIKSLTKSNIFQNYIADYIKQGLLTLDGEESVNGKPAFKVKAVISPEATAIMFIDKSSYQLVKTTADVNQGGQAMTIESYPTDYTETNGVILPMKTTSSMSGMDMILTFTKVEVDTPIEDSVFVAKQTAETGLRPVFTKIEASLRPASIFSSRPVSRVLCGLAFFERILNRFPSFILSRHC
jgi:outer membrane lipoprotein-sorting protein